MFRTESNVEHSDDDDNDNSNDVNVVDKEDTIENEELGGNNILVDVEELAVESGNQATGQQKKRKKMKKVDDFEKQLITILENRNKEEDPDKLFLLSLLPKVKSLTEDQKVLLNIEFLKAFQKVKNSVNHSSYNSTFFPVNYNNSSPRTHTQFNNPQYTLPTPHYLSDTTYIQPPLQTFNSNFSDNLQSHSFSTPDHYYIPDTKPSQVPPLSP